MLERQAHTSLRGLENQSPEWVDLDIRREEALLLVENAIQRREMLTDLRDIEHEMVEIGISLSTYLHDEQIPNIILLDRSARAAAGLITHTWRRMYPEDAHPHIWFTNPSGYVSTSHARRFVTEEMTTYGSYVRDKSILSGNMPSGQFRSRDEIVREFKERYPQLVAQRDSPLMVFDTCIHEGDTIKPVLELLVSEGFGDVRVGVVSDDTNLSLVKPDFIALDRIPLDICVPFGDDCVVNKSFDTIVSAPMRNLPMVNDPQLEANNVRNYISQSVRSSHDPRFVA